MMTRQIAESLKQEHLTNLQLVESIKEAESAKEEAESANKEKNRFLSNMSHELRALMHVFFSYTKLCKKRVNNEKMVVYLEECFQVVNIENQAKGLFDKSLTFK